jgi:hypothetical protein
MKSFQNQKKRLLYLIVVTTLVFTLAKADSSMENTDDVWDFTVTDLESDSSREFHIMMPPNFINSR